MTQSLYVAMIMTPVTIFTEFVEVAVQRCETCIIRFVFEVTSFEVPIVYMFALPVCHSSNFHLQACFISIYCGKIVYPVAELVPISTINTQSGICI